MKTIREKQEKEKNHQIKKGATLLILLFFAMVMLFQRESQTAEMIFVRNSEEVPLHGSAQQQRDYLFADEGATQSIPQGTIGTGGASIQETIQTTGRETENIYTGTLYTGTIQTGNIRTGNTSTGSISTGTIAIQETGSITTEPKDCTTPWGTIIKDKDFVLAYQQREDVNTICNIEKRTCNNGMLGGSYMQSSCKEDVTYTYTKAEVISYNQKVLNEYIQPTPPGNRGAEFTTQGKIDETTKPIDKRGTGNNPIINRSGTAQTQQPVKATCITPRGQEIEHGQFVKAYKAPRGFIDLPCDVEIRACVDGNLKGTFRYSTCTFNNTTYTDYLKAGSPKSSTGFLFFERIKKAFRR